MKIRALDARDIHRVAELERFCNPLPWDEASLTSFSPENEKFANHMGWVVESAGNSVVGYVCALVTGGEAEIMILGVDPEVRRQGLGHNLLFECCSEIHLLGVRSIFLELRKSNAPALALYHSLGFRETGIRKAYYADTREDAVQMRKDL